MAYKRISFKEFTGIIGQDFDPEYPDNADNFTPFVWLLGAGMNVSSGIPKTEDICKRIAVFVYLQNGKYDVTRPWDPEDKSRVVHTQRDYKVFFEWWNKQDVPTLEELTVKAKNYLHDTFPGLKAHDTDDPYFYQELFQPTIFHPKNKTSFISTLLSTGKGVNLANLGLAGILRDFPKLGHTVFTTNYDDLLLQAILSLGCNAKVIDAEEISESIPEKPNFPRIVYLNGRQTGPSLKMNDEELTEAHKKIKKGIIKGIEGSNLIVIGYSGWRDLARMALEDLEKKGVNIYWVPHKDEYSLSEEVLAFLNSFPPGIVSIIQNTGDDEKAPPLNADSFFLSLCEYLNAKNGGIASYRNELLNQAAKQHRFVLKQLDDYPDFNPKRGVDLIKEARKLYQDKKIDEALKKRTEAKSLILDDLPVILKAELYQELGFFDLFLREYNLAIENFMNALENWQYLTSIEGKKGSDSTFALVDGKRAHENIFDIRLALAECWINLADFYVAKEHLILARAMENKKLVVDPEKVASISLFFATIALYEGHGQSVKPNLKEFILRTAKLEEENFPRLFAHYNFLSGAHHFHYTGHISKAKVYFVAAANLYESAGQLTEKANCTKYLADIEIRNNEFDNARAMLNECLKIYTEGNDAQGRANVINSFGDLNFQQAILSDQDFLQQCSEEALIHYRNAIAIYEKNNSKFNLMNGLTDLSILYKEVLNKAEWGSKEMPEDEYIDLKIRLNQLMPEVKNAYAASNLGSTNNSPNSEESSSLDTTAEDQHQ